jgi:hypothetical protein
MADWVDARDAACCDSSGLWIGVMDDKRGLEVALGIPWWPSPFTKALVLSFRIEKPDLCNVRTVIV